MQLRLIILLLALAIDRKFGDPEWLWKHLPHPVVLFGKAIETGVDIALRENDTPHAKRTSGMLTVVTLLLMAALAGWIFGGIFAFVPIAGVLLECLFVSLFLAQKSLADHVGAVAVALREDGLERGRMAVSLIVGRDPAMLDEHGVARAAIESLAENTSDGVAAPALWYVVAGLPGLLAYKMLNTADSLIGHRSARYIDFGRMAAKTDDLANWIPARLTGVLCIIAAYFRDGHRNASGAFQVLLRDARQHRSPNAGWPEAAFAAVLGIALSGPRTYDGKSSGDLFINAGGRQAVVPSDIDSAIALFWRLCSVLMIATAALAVIA